MNYFYHQQTLSSFVLVSSSSAELARLTYCGIGRNLSGVIVVVFFVISNIVSFSSFFFLPFQFLSFLVPSETIFSKIHWNQYISAPGPYMIHPI